MRIEVKRKHIRAGVQASAESCPIALAIKETLGARRVRVRGYFIEIGKKIFPSPEIVNCWVRDFDDRKILVKPFSFEL